MNDWTICNWENNKCSPGVRFIPRIIGFLGYDPHPAPQSLAERLLAKRRHLGLSRKGMAAMLSVDEGTLKRWEKGKSQPTGRGLHIVENLLTASSEPL